MVMGSRSITHITRAMGVSLVKACVQAQVCMLLYIWNVTLQQKCCNYT